MLNLVCLYCPSDAIVRGMPSLVQSYRRRLVVVSPRFARLDSKGARMKESDTTRVRR